MVQPVDAIDREILELLIKRARLSNRSIARTVHISESNSYERIRRLIESGIIRGFHADVDPGALGRPVHAVIMLKVRKGKRKQMLAEAQELSKLDGVAEVFFLAGQYDLLVRVSVRDSGALRDFITDLNSRQTIASTETNIIMEEFFDLSGPDPVDDSQPKSA